MPEEEDSDNSGVILAVVIVLVVVAAIVIVIVIYCCTKYKKSQQNKIVSLQGAEMKSAPHTANNSSSMPADSEDDGDTKRGAVKDTEQGLPTYAQQTE